MIYHFKDYKKLLSFAWPLIIANSFWNLQLTIDRVFLGAYSTEALGAAMAVMGVFWVPMALLQQTAAYVTTFVAQYYGAKEFEKLGSCFWQSIYVSIVGGILFLLQNYFSPTFFSMVGHSSIIQQIEVDYFNSVAYSALPTALVAAMSGYFTGQGQTRTVIGINFVGLILNVLFDYVMIFGHWGSPALGVKGAGYATALATYGAAVYGLYLIYQQDKNENLNLFKKMQMNMSLMKQFLKFGIPSGFQWALEGLAFTVFLLVLGQQVGGEAVLASSSIAITIMMLSVLPTMGVAQAVQSRVGQLLGENNPNEAEKVTWTGVHISVVYIFFVALSFALIPDFYLSWFKNEENLHLWHQVQLIAPGILQIVGLFTMFDSLYLNFSFALKGAGDTKFVSLVALTFPWPFMVLPAYIFRAHENAVYYSWGFCAFYVMLTALVIMIRFRQGKWKSMRVIQ